MNPILPIFRNAREQHRDERRQRRRERQLLVKPDPPSRPSLLFATRQTRIPELTFTAPLVVVWALAISLLGAEAFRAHATSLLYGHKVAATLLLLVSLGCLILVFVDIASYRPRLFAFADNSGSALIDAFEDQSGDLEAAFSEFHATPLTKWSQVPSRQEQILSLINQYVEVGGLRARIAARILHRLTALLVALGLIAYALSTLTGGEVVEHAAANAGLAEHLYFVVAQAMTIGFGDLHPQHGLWGYALMGLSVLTMAAIVYFVLAEVIASQAQFRTDLRTAVERYVVSMMKF